MMMVIGVTGGVGTGKSTVARMLGELGAVVIDADQLAHELIEPKRVAWRRVVETFGEAFLNDDQTVNRKKLGERVFRDEEARRQLEAIIHPQVFRRIKQQLHRLKRNRQVRMVVLDVPLLVETDAQSLADALVVVTAPPDVQQDRLRKIGWSEEEVDRRIAAQWDLSAKAALADYVVDNADGLDKTRKQVKELWNQLVQARHRRRA